MGVSVEKHPHGGGVGVKGQVVEMEETMQRTGQVVEMEETMQRTG